MLTVVLMNIYKAKNQKHEVVSKNTSFVVKGEEWCECIANK